MKGIEVICVDSDFHPPHIQIFKENFLRRITDEKEFNEKHFYDYDGSADHKRVRQRETGPNRREARENPDSYQQNQF
jgi:hypothetical protein